MSHWNHRVIDHGVLPSGETWMAIHEVFYDDSGEPVMWSQEPDGVCGEDLESLRWTLDAMILATAKPVLKKSELPGGKD